MTGSPGRGRGARVATRIATRVVVALALAVAIGLLAMRVFGGEPRTELTLTEFRTHLAAGEIDTTRLFDQRHALEGALADGTRYQVEFPEQYTDQITEQILDADLDLPVDQSGDSIWSAVLFNLLPVVLILGVLVYFMRQVQGGGRLMGFGKARAKLVDVEEPDVTFADVAGLDEAVDELREVQQFLAEPGRFRDLGARVPKGILLTGPPGTGKTLLARAVAGEAGAPFFSISGSDFVEMFVGVGASRVRDMFRQARDAAPAIVFIDEIDAVGRQRGAGVGGGHDEREQTLNQMLVEMDGFDPRDGVIILASTNRPDILDPALLRPGRFDRQVVVDRPDLAGRRAILEVHARGKPVAAGIDLAVVARRTPGFTGADLANLLNEAALLTARGGWSTIGMPQIEEAIDRVLAGPERRTRIISEHERRVIANHEAGHAIVAHVLPTTDPVHKVSIIPRGRTLGVTMTLPTEDRFLVTRSELRDQLVVLLGGRSAEEIVFSEPTTGAKDDIERATAIAHRMVTEFGMSDELGPVHLGRDEHEVFLGRDLGHRPEHSDAVAAGIDAEVRRMVDVAHADARRILVANRHVLDLLASELVARETLDAGELAAIFDRVGGPDADDVSRRDAGASGGAVARGEAPSHAAARAEPPGDGGMSP